MLKMQILSPTKKGGGIFFCFAKSSPVAATVRHFIRQGSLDDKITRDWIVGLEHRVLVDIGQTLLKGEESGRILHHCREQGLVLSPQVGIAHWRMLLVLYFAGSACVRRMSLNTDGNLRI